MVAEPQESKPVFKDYCLILQVHPVADAEMVDTAYWHLARRYSEARKKDPSAKAKMDDLNEAYSVLRSSARREEYLRARDAFLGEGALPEAPKPAREAPPLPVMEKQHVRSREEPETGEDSTKRAFDLGKLRVPLWATTFFGLMLLTLGSAALFSWAHPLVWAALVAVEAFIGSVPYLRRLLSARALWLPRVGAQRPVRATPAPERILQSTDEMRTRLREHNQADASWVATPLDLPATTVTPERGSGSSGTA